MESTDGFGRQAEVWLNGHLLCVCDYVSTPDRRCPPGPLEDVRFTYRSDDAVSWERAIAANVGRRKLLEHVRSWSYSGFGQVVAIMPVVVDFGLLRMEEPNWTSDEGLIGKFVRIHVDRLEIVPRELT